LYPSYLARAAAAVLLLCAAAHADLKGHKKLAPTPPEPPRYLAPYLDVTTAPAELPVMQASSGANLLTLAFIVDHGGCRASWGGRILVASDNRLRGEIRALREVGGDAIFSFGGYNGPELARGCLTVKSLKAAYAQILSRYQARIFDFDVEHDALGDEAANDRRAQALRQLEDEHPDLRVHFTLPVSPAGLNDASLALLRNAKKNGLRIDLINLMTMDYAVPVDEGGMSQRAISSIQGVVKQLESLGVDADLGVTPMIGVNDSPGEIFTFADARRLLDYIRAHRERIRLLSFWSLARDHNGCEGVVRRDCSGLPQRDWAFTRLFRSYLKESRP